MPWVRLIGSVDYTCEFEGGGVIDYVWSAVMELFFVMMVGGSEIILHKRGYKDSDPSSFPRAR